MINRDILFQQWLQNDVEYIAQADFESVLRRAYEAGYEQKEEEQRSMGANSSYRSFEQGDPIEKKR